MGQPNDNTLLEMLDSNEVISNETVSGETKAVTNEADNQAEVNPENSDNLPKPNTIEVNGAV